MSELELIEKNHKGVRQTPIRRIRTQFKKKPE
jgi:hypothetical protein